MGDYKLQIKKNVETIRKVVEADRKGVAFEDLCWPRRGRWITVGFMAAKCSCCDEVFYELDGFNFCPNCGAQMDSAD